ncbi:hypothetical protein CFBP2533_25790 [Xanthomonas hortorum pv. pelargonii]|uniref:Uncharacterized protein n=1 Tax=Xanthomonas hortorum pv. pelargonii TaxID=453602 RepID=A0A6V7DP16_9XANT|nr:hypothetical protein CFBP2533_25790 [Xanthomonas hortorum pv. pelargonii]CAD0337891.1 hypothetical protein CFBP2533_25790 [Xanthomonas hortorum pv. pelargonii]
MPGAFFSPGVRSGASLPVLWRAVRGGRKARRFLESGTPTRTVRHPDWRRGGGFQSTQGIHHALRRSRSAGQRRRQIAHYFGLIADTLDWNHTAWLALQAKLQAMGKAPEALTLADVEAAISSINADLAEVRQ